MKKNEDQEENLEQKTNVNESSINKGDEFMRLRKVKKDVDLDKEELVPKGGKEMNTAVVLTLSVIMTIGGTLIGFIFGWLANAYYDDFRETLQAILTEDKEEVATITPHPEMMDSQGNLIPFQIAKLVSVEFEPSDAFDMDPFPDSDDD
jgi:F0F1-type ATP synthase assembly protein I